MLPNGRRILGAIRVNTPGAARNMGLTTSVDVDSLNLPAGPETTY